MTSPLSPEAVAQMVAELRRYRAAMYGSGWLWVADDVERAADMLTTLAAENATLRERQGKILESLSQSVGRLDTLRASEAAARERVTEWQEARKACIASSITHEQLSRLANAEAALALTPTADKE